VTKWIDYLNIHDFTKCLEYNIFLILYYTHVYLTHYVLNSCDIYTGCLPFRNRPFFVNSQLHCLWEFTMQTSIQLCLCTYGQGVSQDFKSGRGNIFLWTWSHVFGCGRNWIVVFYSLNLFTFSFRCTFPSLN
jgi:hypothetical protein